MQINVQDEIFDRYPDLQLAVISIKSCTNSGGDVEVQELLSEACQAVRSQWSAAKLTEDPRLAAWREAYRAFGAKPKKYKSSIENLLGMVVRGGEVRSINTIVDLYNAISLRHVIPVGGDDLDCVSEYISLTIAEGTERFVPLNGDEPMAPKAGEVIYRDAEDVLCRRWNWRECDKSKLTEASKNVALVLEGLPPVAKADLAAAAEELAELVVQYCGGLVSVTMIDANERIAEIQLS